MDNNLLDRLFREKIGKINDLPSDIIWNSDKGWNEYERKYFSGIFSKRIILYIGSAAAVVFFMVSLFMIQHGRSHETIIVSNETLETKEIVLPDKNRIWLNKSSFAEYPSEINKQIELVVSGEVYLELKAMSNSRYKIEANNAVIVAEKPCKLNIRARQNEENVNVTVSLGSVMVMEKNNQSGLALLIPEGNYCSIHKSQNLVYSSVIRNNNYLAWKTGKLSFDSTPMATVSDILDDYYQTKIEFEDKNLAYCRFTGTFERQPIEAILNQIQSELNFVVRNTGTGIKISGKGCLTF
jgi:transmembrane sensor